MTAVPSIDPARFLNEQLSQASPDLMRDLLTTFVNALLGAQADAVCGAGYGERSEERVNSRNGYRHRDLDTRVGTLDVAVPKLRTGSLFPEVAFTAVTSRRKADQVGRRLVVRSIKRVQALSSDGTGREPDFLLASRWVGGSTRTAAIRQPLVQSTT